MSPLLLSHVNTLHLSFEVCIGSGDFHCATDWTVLPPLSALRGAATLRARRIKEARSLAAVTPYERAASCPSISFSGQDTEAEESEAEYNCQDILSRGCEFLKRSRNGKTVIVHVYSSSYADFGGSVPVHCNLV